MIPFKPSMLQFRTSTLLQDDDELQGKVYHLNRPDAMTEEEWTRNRWASNLDQSMAENRGSDCLKIRAYTE